MLPVPAIAGTIDCPDGSPDGAICYQGTDPLGEWIVEVVAYNDICGQDKKGNDIYCTKFDYVITDHPDGVFANQANVKIPVCDTGDFSIVSPTDRSVKIRVCDPNSGLWCNDIQSRAITFDALKTDPDNPTYFNVAVSPAGVVETTLGLVTELGNVLVPTLGPDCCSQTQVTTQIDSAIGPIDPDPNALFTGLTVNYGICSSIPTSISYFVAGEPQQAIELQYGLAHCDQNSRTGDVDTKSCKKITKFGPESGLYVLADKVDACILGNGDDGTSTECAGYGYYGWGNKIYQFELMVPYPGVVPDPALCNENITPVPRKGSVIIDDLVQIIYDGCGNGTIKDAKTGLVLADPYNSTPPIYLVPYDSSGKLDLTQKAVVVSGSAEGVSFYGSSCWFTGRTYVCR